MREFHAGAEWDLLEVRHLRRDERVQLNKPFNTSTDEESLHG